MASTSSAPLSERKQQILDTARDLFSRKGYVAASMRDLAEELQIKPASLYSHYKSKDEILWEIAIRAKEAFFEKVLPLGVQEETALEVRLSNMVKAHVQVIIENIDASAIFFGEWKHLQEPLRTQFADFQHVYEQSFENLILAGIELRIFREQPGRYAARSLLASVNWIHKWYKADAGMSPKEIGMQAAAFGLAGLK